MAAVQWSAAVVLLLSALLQRTCGQTGQFASLDTWTYKEENYWSDVDPMCIRGSQSPININTSKMINGGSYELHSFSSGRQVGPLVWSFAHSTVKSELSTTRSTWLLELDSPYSESTTSSYFGSEFQLKSISFHSPSENTIDGMHYDMEAQLRHARTVKGGHTEFLVTSVMFEVVEADAGQDADNEFLKYFWNDFPAYSYPKSTKRTMFIGNPYHFLYPADRSCYIFDGSLTEPPCSPAVCVVFAMPNRLSARQLQAFRSRLDAVWPSALSRSPAAPAPAGVSCASGCPSLNYTWSQNLGMNARSLQSMGNRWVKYVKMIPPDSQPENILARGRWLWIVAALAIALLACCVVGIAMLDTRRSAGGSGRDKQKELGADDAHSSPEARELLHPASDQHGGAYPQVAHYQPVGAPAFGPYGFMPPLHGYPQFIQPQQMQPQYLPWQQTPSYLPNDMIPFPYHYGGAAPNGVAHH